MRYLFLLVLFFASTVKGQSVLTFDHRFVESENKWVALKPNKDSSLSYGFIYIDASAGLTLNYEGTFTISKDGKFIPKRLDSIGMKYRLKPNNVKVAIIPQSKFSELGILEYPKWLSIYLGDTNSVGHLYKWGLLYNEYDECAKALTYLEKAQKINPKYKGLDVELAFSYNCLAQYNKAIEVLKNALETNPTDAYFYKELIFAQVKSGQLDKASENCKKGIVVCTDKSYNGEMCYNLLREYYLRKDKVNCHLWLDETKKWNLKNSELNKSIKIIEEDISK